MVLGECGTGLRLISRTRANVRKKN